MKTRKRELLTIVLTMVMPLLSATGQDVAEEGRATQGKASGPILRLEDLEQMALANNPTLKQAAAEVRVAAGRRQQAGLYPNPTVGYTGEEIRGGFARGGQQGFFVEQTFVLGGKLGKSRQIFEQERVQAEAEAEEQRFRVLNAVRLLYYQALGAQEMLALDEQLAKLAGEAVATTRQLHNVGQADLPDLLQAEIEQQQAELAVIVEQNSRERVWRALAAVVGRPGLMPAPLQGSLEADLPALDADSWLQALIRESPAVKIARAGVSRAEAMTSRASAQPIPDLKVRAGIQQNRELMEATGRAVGLQWFAEVGVEIPLFNRNRGAVEAARAERERALEEVRRVELVLRERSASLWSNYQSARALAERYRTQMLPRAQKAHELYLAKYEIVAASYPQVLIAQRTRFQLQRAYIDALTGVWTNAIALRGYLLTDGLEAPAKSGEMDLPVREINVPRGRMMMMEER
ncbi:MAG: TolC family protein [Acidobacteria bacterium]|nr:TolC family protein [Acidobacteriota bacterium]